MSTTTKTLIELATLTGEDEAPDRLSTEMTIQELFKAISTVARDKALWAVVDWWAARSDTKAASELRNMLTAAGIERP